MQYTHDSDDGALDCTFIFIFESDHLFVLIIYRLDIYILRESDSCKRVLSYTIYDFWTHLRKRSKCKPTILMNTVSILCEHNQDQVGYTLYINCVHQCTVCPNLHYKIRSNVSLQLDVGMLTNKNIRSTTSLESDLVDLMCAGPLPLSENFNLRIGFEINGR